MMFTKMQAASLVLLSTVAPTIAAPFETIAFRPGQATIENSRPTKSSLSNTEQATASKLSINNLAGNRLVRPMSVSDSATRPRNFVKRLAVGGQADALSNGKDILDNLIPNNIESDNVEPQLPIYSQEFRDCVAEWIIGCPDQNPFNNYPDISPCASYVLGRCDALTEDPESAEASTPVTTTTATVDTQTADAATTTSPVPVAAKED